MVRRSTWIALIVLAALISLAIYLKQPRTNLPETAATSTRENQPVFASEEGQPASIRIEAGPQGSFEMLRGADQAWVIQLPFFAKADPARAEAASTQISALRLLADVDVAPADVGLAQPSYVFTLGFSGGSRHTLKVGDQTPSGAGYYASLDDGQVVIVSGAGIEGLLTLLSAPPYLETPTPSPVPPTGTPRLTEIPETSTPMPGSP